MCSICEQASTPASNSYVAAVVEFAPKFFNDSKAILNSNVPMYVKYIEDAQKQNADIIVFPEDGLTTYHLPERSKLDSWTTVIPAPTNKYTPCSENMTGVSEALKNISCAAKKNKIYVVVNLPEKLPCTGDGDCPKDNIFYYNTNVVFDRNGTIIARYRKVNLFVEPQFNVTKEPEIVTFDTDFGVKFGTFICFDILFATPALNLTRNLGVTDIVFTTAWFSEVPFLTAVQTQAGWSYAEDVNLLASGYNNPTRGNAGSGIYLGRGGIKEVAMPLATSNVLLVAEVPKKGNKMTSSKMQNQEMHEHDHVHVHLHDELRKKREDLRLSELKLLRDNLILFEMETLKGNVTTKRLCQHEFCCDFTIRMSRMDPKINYRAVVYNGVRNFVNIRQAAIRACAVIQCSNDSVESCGSVASSETIFDGINISGKFDDSLNSLIMPNTLKTSMLPFKDGWTYDEHKHESHKHVSMTLNKTTTDLLTFGVYCRDYDKDDSNATSSVIFYWSTIFLAFLLSRFL